MNMKDHYENSLASGIEIEKRFQEITKAPLRHNMDLLMRILNDSKDTEYGKKYDFSNIKSFSEYKHNVPVTTYDDYAASVARMVAGEENILTAYPINHFAATSGTLGAEKLIPTSTLGQIKFHQYSVNFFNKILSDTFGSSIQGKRFLKMLVIHLNTLPTGATTGSISSKLIVAYKDVFEKTSVSPWDAFDNSPDVDKRYIHARFSLAAKDLGSIFSIFVTSVLELMRYIETNHEMLAYDIEHGTIHESIHLPNDVKERLMQKITPNPERAAELRKIFAEGFVGCCRKIWPDLQYVEAIASGGFIDYTNRLKEYLGQGIAFYYQAYAASEGYFSVAVALDDPESVFVPDSCFFEFLPLGDTDYSKTLTIDQLVVGEKYEIIITNQSGFYRYKMRDYFEVASHYNSCPKIRFIGRVDQTVNMFGEKVSEPLLRAAIKDASEKMQIDVVDFSVYPDYISHPARYEYLVEVHPLQKAFDTHAFAALIDEALCNRTADYPRFRQDKKIDTVAVTLLQSEAYQLYKDLRAARGASVAQIKPPRILTDANYPFFKILQEEQAANAK